MTVLLFWLSLLISELGLIVPARLVVIVLFVLEFSSVELNLLITLRAGCTNAQLTIWLATR